MAVLANTSGAPPVFSLGASCVVGDAPHQGNHDSYGPVRLSFPDLFRLVLACFLPHGTIKSAEISRLFHQPNSPDIAALKYWGANATTNFPVSSSVPLYF